MKYKMILLDLDGTLLRSDRTISDYTVRVINECKAEGCIIGIATARGETNARPYIAKIDPQIVIASGGALVKNEGQTIFVCAFSDVEAKTIIDAAMLYTDNTCEITVDTIGGHYWNYKVDPQALMPDWGEVTYTDYQNFFQPSLKMSIELPDRAIAQKIALSIPECDMERFSDGQWYKFTKKTATKANAIYQIVESLGVKLEEILAFGDDYVDIEMLKICGTGVAMGNAIEAVKSIADAVTVSNDEDGVAKYLEQLLRE